ncbi:hypothetical protein HLB23_17950 [Nocardia uniformis]|uniref:Uncharacterized protein n=2 Tax=Nocardia uniformis TaxID=53432 RepID=A0A849CEN5_9NOCA|nr:hypothetical protein [Nocardia uniformis]NNH71721.1 hypothetical protein [Nocardia uniformis]
MIEEVSSMQRILASLLTAAALMTPALLATPAAAQPLPNTQPVGSSMFGLSMLFGSSEDDHDCYPDPRFVTGSAGKAVCYTREEYIDGLIRSLTTGSFG